MIQVHELFKTYVTGQISTPVLKHISFTVNKGEFVSITGKSGSGKSTLLYQLGLLDMPTSGTIHLNGVDTNNLSDSDRGMFRLTELGYVFQDYALIPSLTASENVMLPLIMRGADHDASRSKALSTLERVGLADKANNLPSQLSGGQQQRVSIARAISHDPKILFADEPTANLDNETSDQILQTFLGLHASGQTIVMITHEMEYAQLTDRIITLSDGIISTETQTQKRRKSRSKTS